MSPHSSETISAFDHFTCPLHQRAKDQIWSSARSRLGFNSVGLYWSVKFPPLRPCGLQRGFHSLLRVQGGVLGTLHSSLYCPGAAGPSCPASHLEQLKKKALWAVLAVTRPHFFFLPLSLTGSVFTHYPDKCGSLFSLNPVWLTSQNLITPGLMPLLSTILYISSLWTNEKRHASVFQSNRTLKSH